MSGEPTGLRVADHVVGAACATGVFACSARIGTAASQVLSWCLQHLGAGTQLGFISGHIEAPWWTLVIGLGLLGAMVAGLDRMVRARRIRVWAPPLVVPIVATAAFVPLLAADGAGWRVGSVIGGALGVLVGIAFAAWWFASLGSARVLRAPRPRATREP